MIGACIVAMFVTLALILTPRIHVWDERRQWEALLQEARDCTAARDNA